MGSWPEVIAVTGVVLIGLAAMIGMAVLHADGIRPPAELAAVAGAAVGGLAGYLARQVHDRPRP